jgi:hypothetical protein
VEGVHRLTRPTAEPGDAQVTLGTTAGQAAPQHKPLDVFERDVRLGDCQRRFIHVGRHDAQRVQRA